MAVKVTLSDGVPVPGVAVEVVQAKLPAGDAVPPLSAEELSDCPKVIGLAVGHPETVGVALLMVKLAAP
jgi:hypothetical protein